MLITLIVEGWVFFGALLNFAPKMHLINLTLLTSPFFAQVTLTTHNILMKYVQ